VQRRKHGREEERHSQGGAGREDRGVRQIERGEEAPEHDGDGDGPASEEEVTADSRRENGLLAIAVESPFFLPTRAAAVVRVGARSQAAWWTLAATSRNTRGEPTGLTGGGNGPDNKNPRASGTEACGRAGGGENHSSDG
jgi:hypothetical protein